MVIYADAIKLMFIHAPKTGGSSVTRALDPYISRTGKRTTGRAWQGSFHNGGMHADYEEQRKKIDHLLWEDWTLTATVRNPFTLMQSLHNKFGEGKTMVEFMRDAFANPDMCRLCGIYFRKTFTDIVGPADPVMRFESLEEDFAALTQQWDIEAELPSPRPPPHHISVYEPQPHSKESIELVERHFAVDLERWGYTAPEM
jgi:hypothetical protein